MYSQASKKQKGVFWDKATKSYKIRQFD